MMPPPSVEVLFLRRASVRGFYVLRGGVPLFGPFSEEKDARAHARRRGLRLPARAPSCPFHGSPCSLAGRRGNLLTWGCGRTWDAEAPEVWRTGRDNGWNPDAGRRKH